MAVILQMDGNYPDISLGIISFKNADTGATVKLEAPEDLQEGTYGVRSITLDTGAASTILPGFLAKRLDINPSHLPGREVKYFIFGGVGGTSLCFLSPDSIVVEIEDERGNKINETIMPFFLVKYAPSITSEGRLLASPKYQPYTEAVTPFISPPFNHSDNYTVEVRSPPEKFTPQNRRLKLEVDVGENINYILIGRDWQEAFQLIFEADKMIIKER